MDERRKYERYPVSLQATVRQDDRQPQACLVSDVSREGVRLLLHEKIQFGQTVDLAIEMPGATHPLAATMTVRWNRRVYDQGTYEYLAGGEMHGSDDAVMLLLLDYARTSGRPS